MAPGDATTTEPIQLPKELLREILLCCEYEDRIAACLVCRDWRDIAQQLLACAERSIAIACDWPSGPPFQYNFITICKGSTPSTKKDHHTEDRYALQDFSARWVTWPHYPLSFEVLLRDWRGRPLERCRSATNFGLTVTYQLKCVIPYEPSEKNNGSNSNSKICTHSNSSFHIHESPAAMAGEIRFYNRPLHLLKGEHARDLLASVIYGELNESKSYSSSSGGGGSVSDGDYGDSNPGSSSNSNTCRGGGGGGGASRAGCNMLELPLIGYIARKRKEEEPCGFDVGFYICLMDRYSYGADTLVFEFSVKLGGAHISGSPFTLNFFNPLLP